MRRFHPLSWIPHNIPDEKPHRALLSAGITNTSLRGFANLLVIIFLATNCREVVANTLKYGILVSWLPSRKSALQHSAFFVSVLAILLNAALAFYLERMRGMAFSAARQLREETSRRAAKHHSNDPKMDLRKAIIEEEGEEEESRISNAGSKVMQEGDVVMNTSFAVNDNSAEIAGTPTDNVDGPIDKGHEHSTATMCEHVDAVRVGDQHEGDSPRTGSGRRKTVTTTADDLGSSSEEEADVPRVSPNTRKALTMLVVDLLNDQQLMEEAAEHLHVAIITVTAVLMIAVPYLLVSYGSIPPSSASVVVTLSLTWFLKLTSFHHVLHDCRVIFLNHEEVKEVCPFAEEAKGCEDYPTNLTFKSFCLYMAYPTLCYQFSYKRKESTDWRVVWRCCAQILLCILAIKILIEQYMTVIVQNAFVVINDHHVSIIRLLGHFIERMLKLSLPTLYVWLLIFFSFFHLWLILLAELTRFEDQFFYDDWWNATSFGEYWRKWNLPVHNFCTRHIYKPLLMRGWSRFLAGQFVFVLSALAHEYMVVAPLKIGWTGLVFTAFVLQTPLAIISNAHLARAHPTLGNMFFWIVFCFTGQPLAVMVFYYLWNIRHGDWTAIQILI